MEKYAGLLKEVEEFMNLQTLLILGVVAAIIIVVAGGYLINKYAGGD